MPSLECGEIDNEHENENDEEKIGSDRREFRFYQPTEKQTRTKDDEKGFRNDAKQIQARSAWSHEENSLVPAGRLNGSRLRLGASDKNVAETCFSSEMPEYNQPVASFDDKYPWD